VDTGAIEGLYETDRGFTFTVAMQAAHWQAAAAEKGPEVLALFESHLDAYDYVLDLATQQVPIAEAWIRKLHAEVCRAQETYMAWTGISWQEQALPKGEYKHLPNHVQLADGTIHSYAPVDMTPTEMYRLCQELRSDEFLAAHPVLQASYAHYAFVVIHPFADGNGRVARALASVFTYRSQSVPLLILVDSRREYLSSLRSADNGDYQEFVYFVLERMLDAISLVNESLRTAALPTADDSLTALRDLYMTKGGYSHVEVDEAGYRFFELFHKELTRQLEITGIRFEIEKTSISSPELAKPTSRWPVAQGIRELDVKLRSDAPADAEVRRIFLLEVPKDCGREDDFIIQERQAPNLRQTTDLIEARITELSPRTTAALEMRLSIAVARIMSKATQDLLSKASESIRKKGY
jgi:Fic family protein